VTDAAADVPLLDICELSVAFPSEAGDVHAVRELSYQLAPGETLGIVGESGSGKTVSSLAILDLLPRHARISGSIRFRGVELTGRSDRELSDIRGRQIGMIFQDPLSALTPVYSVGDQIAEAVLVHAGPDISRAAARERAVELLSLVGIASPRQRATAFPHEFSGGMRQRVMIAMALACEPKLLIADEPTTALDVTIQAQILDLLRGLQETLGTAIILITHDLGVVAETADRVAVMYAGKIVETASAEAIFADAQHPYTLGLLASVPRIEQDVERLQTIPGSVPHPAHMPAGCRFSPRCALATPKCKAEPPPLSSVAPGHEVACWLAPIERTA
jgi:oligopeptide/dipeptide ABC transporter ATP-binding protein